MADTGSVQDWTPKYESWRAKSLPMIQEGKTKVRFRAVEVGLVEEINFSDDLESVVLTIQMDKGTAPYLTDTTEFWVVKPRIVAGEVQGLDTLTKGAYIGMQPSDAGDKERQHENCREKAHFQTEGKNGKIDTHCHCEPLYDRISQNKKEQPRIPERQQTGGYIGQ